MAMLRVNEVAQDKGLNISQLSMRAHLNLSIVNRYWHNKIRAVSLDVLEAMARALDVQVTDLISNEPDVQGDDIRADIAELRKSNPALADRLHQMMLDGFIAAPGDEPKSMARAEAERDTDGEIQAVHPVQAE